MENRELISKALSYIKSEAGTPSVSVEDVATHAGFSTDYFNRIFTAHTGFNVMEYLRFTRLKKASLLLRTTDSDILTIALDCGYEAHESFTRAFKAQYGKTPSEYRQSMKSVEAYYGEFNNDTVGERLVHEFPQLKIADTDEVIDYLLEKDAIKYGYDAVCFHINGGAALYDEAISEGFAWCTEWDGKYEIEIVSENYNAIARYCKLFSDDRFTRIILVSDCAQTVETELKKHGVNCTVSKEIPEAIYRGTPYDLSAPEGISVRELCYDDYSLIDHYYQGKQAPFLKHLRDELEARDIYENREHSVFVFGVFHGYDIVGISLGTLQRVHGFVVNNCVSTSLLSGYEREELYRYVFRFVTNAALEKGALPIDDIQYEGASGRCGSFNSADLGYEIVMRCHILEK